jgi:hypothetical protein
VAQQIIEEIREGQAESTAAEDTKPIIAQDLN